MFDQLKLGIILNPAAGRGRARYAAKLIIEYLHRKKIPFYLEKTSGPGDAKDIAAKIRDKFEIIVAAGGDGTVNEVATGIIGSKAALALLPIGSGNDFNRIIEIPKRISHAIDFILNGKRKLLDIGQVSIWNSHGEKTKRFFINTLGMGLDAEIANETKNIKFIRGLPLYLLAAVKAIRKHSPNEYKIKEGNKTRTEQAFLICIGNGSYEGGGFKLLPNAAPDDSFLDTCLIRTMPILKILRLIPCLIKGTHGGERRISIWKSRQISIKASKPFILHGDGEILENNTIRAEIELAAKKICVIVPDKY
jgi:YegS/Rv2252/BmrU family lipid kinase